MLVQIEFLKEMQKQFFDMNTEYQRHLKSKEKAEAKKQREEEKQLQRSSLKYSLRIQLILEQLDEATKESFRAGWSDGAIKLSEAELKQVDDFYTLVNPQRAGNTRYVY